MKKSNPKKPKDLHSLAKNLLTSIDDTGILTSRRLADDTKRLRILEMRKELDSILNKDEDS